MKLVRLVFGHAPWAMTGVLLLSTASAVLSVAVIAFINDTMLSAEDVPLTVLWQFAALLAVLLVLSAGAHAALTALGHDFVYTMRRALVKRVLDTDIERLETIGEANIIASLSDDLRKITEAFVGLPQLVYGLVLSAATFGYLAWLSLPLFITVLAWTSVIVVVGGWLVVRLHRHLRALRESVDTVYQRYESILDGRKELALNRHRARREFDDEFDVAARRYRHHVTLADRFNGLAINWSNAMVLGTIGLIFYLALGRGWAPTSVAATYALAILFLRSPLLSTIGTLPAQMGASVALRKIESLDLAPYRPQFDLPASRHAGAWRQIELRDMVYRYRTDEPSDCFTVGPIDFTLERGETVFLVGGNGSGKTTLARLLTGLYTPQDGELRIDGQTITEHDAREYQALFAAVLTDFHLFDQLLGTDHQAADPALVDEWLQRLAIANKVGIDAGRVTHGGLSQGQRKRLALMLALLEQRDILVLDEWAADQDPQFRRAFYRELLPLLKASGRTIVAITHDDSYFDLADRVLHMESGRLIELDARRDALAAVNAVRESS